MFKFKMNSDIIDEIERYLSKYRCEKMHINVEDECHIEQVDLSGFNKSWCKLGLAEKLNRLMKYHNKMALKFDMVQAKSDSLRRFFYDNVNTVLASDEFVSYDPQNSEIITIIGLKYDVSDFYIDDPSLKPKQEGIRVKHTPIFNLEQLNLSKGNITKTHSDVANLNTAHNVKDNIKDNVKDNVKSKDNDKTEEKQSVAPVKKTIVIKKK
jgi:hypothetical protein